MRRGLTGWLLVGIQALLIIALVITPQGTSWPTPSWVLRTGWAIGSVGAAWAIRAAFGLGDRLTPARSPVTEVNCGPTGPTPTCATRSRAACS